MREITFDMIRKSVSRISLAVFLFLLWLSASVLAVAGGRVGYFCIMGIFAVPPIAAGPKRYRVLGVIALLIAIAAVGIDYQAGKAWERRWCEIRDQIRKDYENEIAKEGRALFRQSLLYESLSSDSRNGIHMARSYLHHSWGDESMPGWVDPNEVYAPTVDELLQSHEETLDELRLRGSELIRWVEGQNVEKIREIIDGYSDFLAISSPYYPD